MPKVLCTRKGKTLLPRKLKERGRFLELCVSCKGREGKEKRKKGKKEKEKRKKEKGKKEKMKKGKKEKGKKEREDISLPMHIPTPTALPKEETPSPQTTPRTQEAILVEHVSICAECFPKIDPS